MKTLKKLEVNDPVVYIPRHLLFGNRDKMIEERNLGTVTSKNDRFIFVQYKDDIQSKATYPKDLFPLKNRPDLIKLMKTKRVDTMRKYFNN